MTAPICYSYYYRVSIQLLYKSILFMHLLDLIGARFPITNMLGYEQS